MIEDGRNVLNVEENYDKLVKIIIKFIKNMFYNHNVFSSSTCIQFNIYKQYILLFFRKSSEFIDNSPPVVDASSPIS